VRGEDRNSPAKNGGTSVTRIVIATEKPAVAGCAVLSRSFAGGHRNVAASEGDWEQHFLPTFSTASSCDIQPCSHHRNCAIIAEAETVRKPNRLALSVLLSRF